MSVSAEADSLIDAEALSERIHMTTDWIYREVRANRIPHIKLGRYVRFRPATIDDWLSESERASLGEHKTTRRR